MNGPVFPFLSSVSDGSVVTLVLYQGMVQEFHARTSLSSYLGDNHVYFYIYLDQESVRSEFYHDLKQVISSRKNAIVYEYPK